MNNEFMKMAAELSLANLKENKGGPFGAVIVLDGKIIGRGSNLVTSTNDPTAHAEIVAIRDACRNIGHFSLKGSEIYTSCEPCPMCLAAIYWARIEEIYYANTKEDAAMIGFDDSFIYDQISLPMNKRKIKFIKVEEQLAEKAFFIWEKKEDKVDY